ncbi:uncharacterized protein N7479_004673 [Penicillium vulpinum]|uniref:uncharacterized protein n=1 Tax=Penicillium vulpinum TaxID=29845 RepID=UPI002548D84D|nr:uncharacterized protein N7479_004673 [Penicillium vulpinum]KAJ5964797.1 hypothetical protein N7479_004673 [Penicillium vulpinum]
MEPLGRAQVPAKGWSCSFDEAMELLKKWYDDSQKPFFKKKDLEKISNQLNRLYNTQRRNTTQKQLISVRGLSKSTILYEVRTGQVITEEEHKQEWEMQQPKLRYLCYDQITSLVEDGDMALVEAFFPLQIDHLALKRAIDTKLPVLPDYVQNTVPVDEFLQGALETWKIHMNGKSLSPFSSLSLLTKSRNASGSMEFGLGGSQITMRSAIQHSLMISLKESLEEKTNQNINCYSQDPRDTAIDNRDLGQYGCEVSEDPQALLQIDNDCILFSCCPSLPLKEITVDFGRPAMLIWDRVNMGAYGEWSPRSNPNSHRVLNMIENEYDCHEFWDLHKKEAAPFGSHLTIYIRRQAE